MDEDYRRRREAEAARRQASLPGWAEWAAWRWSRGDTFQREIGAELGGIPTSVVCAAIKDYLFIATDTPFELHKRWGAADYEYGWWSINIYSSERRARLRQHFGEHVPPFPGLRQLKTQTMPDVERNRWVYRQRQAGRTLRAIGAEVGISPERVRQICMREKNRDKAA